MTEQRDAAELRRDEQEQRSIGARSKGHRDAIYLAILVIVLFGVSIFWSSHTAVTAANGRAEIEQQQIDADAKLIAALQKSIASDCDFWYPLTSLPVTVNITTGKPTELSVQIITGARESYAGQCTDDGVHRPPLPPPDPSLIRWARYYHLPVTQ